MSYQWQTWMEINGTVIINVSYRYGNQIYEYAYQYCFSRMHTGKKFPKRNQEIVETEAKSKLRTDMTAYFPDLEYVL